MNPNKKKSLETIINTSDNKFITGRMFEDRYDPDTNACAMGHVYKAHNVDNRNLNYEEREEITGLTENERCQIINLNDFGDIEEVKQYCRVLLNEN